MNDVIHLCLKCKRKSDKLLCKPCQEYLKACLTAIPLRVRLGKMLQAGDIDTIFHRASFSNAYGFEYDGDTLSVCGAFFTKSKHPFILVNLAVIGKTFESEPDRICKICQVLNHETLHRVIHEQNEDTEKLDSPWLKRLFEEYL